MFVLGGAALGFRSTRHDLDLIGIDDLAAVLHLERDVFELEGPDLIAESVCIQTPLHARENAKIDGVSLGHTSQHIASHHIA